MCASCQCYITSNHQLPEMESEEEAMLSEAFNVKDNSRLGCQIFINENLEGFSFEIGSRIKLIKLLKKNIFFRKRK